MKTRAKSKSPVVAAAEACGGRDKVYDLFESVLTKIQKKSKRGRCYAATVFAYFLEINGMKNIAIHHLKLLMKDEFIEKAGVFSDEEKQAIENVVWPANMPSDDEVAA